MTIQSISSEEEIRYNRQLILPEIGLQGQIKLKQARVLIAGVGGIGSVSAYYLAAAGIGKLLTNKLLVFNGMGMSFRKIEMEKNPDCPICGNNADIGFSPE